MAARSDAVFDPAVRAQPSARAAQRQNDVFNLYLEFATAHEGELDYSPDDDPDYVEQARAIMGLPVLPPKIG